MEDYNTEIKRSAFNEGYELGYKKGRTMTLKDFIQGVVTLVAVVIVTASVTYCSCHKDSILSQLSTADMINLYQTMHNKVLSEWRKDLILKRCDNLEGEDAWKVVKQLGDDI